MFDKNHLFITGTVTRNLWRESAFLQTTFSLPSWEAVLSGGSLTLAAGQNRSAQLNTFSVFRQSIAAGYSPEVPAKAPGTVSREAVIWLLLWFRVLIEDEKQTATHDFDKYDETIRL